MNKFKLSFLVLVIGGAVGFYLSDKKENITASISKVINSDSDHKVDRKKQKVKQTLSKYIEKHGIEKVKESIKSKSIDKEKITPILVEKVKNYSKCIKNKTCLNNSSERFYDLKLDPVFSKVENLLNGLNYLSDEDPTVLSFVEDEFLYEVASFENKSAFFSANMLIFKKGKESIINSIPMAKKLETKLVGDYLLLLSSDTYMKDTDLRDHRNTLINSYFTEGNHMQIHYTMNSLENIDFEKGEVEQIKETFCELQIRDENEAQKMLNYKFAKFVGKYQVDSKC